MASRKDKKGRVLRKGEFQRASDGKYVYGYTDPLGKRHYIYSKDLKYRNVCAHSVKRVMGGRIKGITDFYRYLICRLPV